MASTRRAADDGGAAPPAAASGGGEHIYIASEDSERNPGAAAQVLERLRLRNPIRRTATTVSILAGGFAEVLEERCGAAGKPHRLDLHYLDPVPGIERVIAKRSLITALGAAGAAALAAAAAQVTVLAPFTLPAAAAAGAIALAALGAAAYLSHERIQFTTLHGRAPVLTLAANIGAIRRYRELVPVLARAIEESAEAIVDDTGAYLRAEMREHYRLRGAGVLSNEVCADSTGRILAQFDVQL